MIEIGTLMDFFGSLSILGMLAIFYGSIRRALPGTWIAESLLGILFGVVAVMQMNAPFEPIPGLIIDMRNVPMVLAGAFLGARGMLLCMVLAIAARLQIGGIGALAGVASILIAGAAGAFWNAATARRTRGPLAMLGLVMLLSTHLVSVVFLPLDVAIWFMVNAAPILIVLYLLSVPVVAGLLDRERRQMLKEAELRRAANIGASDGLMPKEAFAWTLVQASVTGSLRDGASIIAIELRHRGALARIWGTEADKIATAALSARLDALVPDGGIVGWIGPDQAMMAIPAMSDRAKTDFLMHIRREVSSDPIPVPGMAAIRLSLELDARTYDAVPPLDRVLTDMKIKKVGKAQIIPVKRKRAGLAKPKRFAEMQTQTKTARRRRDDLFGTFDRLREARFGQI
ncbi:LytS/YhcK type 5TM receptor domain-containing protein [Jannaschia helgolandensis]|uniref:LytS/YhcK type 5TM receptor domain-containing protein n=1 Tax=Jannaschia helgolandensis TaxID=188906 RepID=UPI0030D88C33|tara:strand:+ start:688 stop:1887 length:1200 start_codon:yes stop_codon:yes gene_type:complete